MICRYDNAYALKQIEEGHNALLSRAPETDAHARGPSKKGRTLPRLITLGGDHTITLPLLRSINREYGPISVIHFDSHLYVGTSLFPIFDCCTTLTKLRDTWRPYVFGGAPTDQAAINHGKSRHRPRRTGCLTDAHRSGTYFWHASNEGLLSNDSNIHAGIRTTLSGLSDYKNDDKCGFQIVEARQIDNKTFGGLEGIVKAIKTRVGLKNPVYLSIDIDTLDPAFAVSISNPRTNR